MHSDYVFDQSFSFQIFSNTKSEKCKFMETVKTLSREERSILQKNKGMNIKMHAKSETFFHHYLAM